MTTVVAALLVAAALLAAIALFRWIADRRADASPPPLFLPMTPPGSRDAIPMVELRRPPKAPAQAVQAEPPNPVSATGAAVLHDNHYFTTNGDTPSPGETVRFVRPTAEPVQLLPGRLEVLAGTTRQREIRFVRTPGEPLHLYVGRDAGPSPQYIGLGVATVSRRHARFAYVDGRWFIKNLSQTNPVVVNDDELSNTDGERALNDGDQIELGEVVLRFHAH